MNAPSLKAIYKEDRCQIDANDVVARFFRPPISLMLLAGVAESSGYEARILDCPACGYTFTKLREVIEEVRPEYIIVNTSEQTLKEDIITIRISKLLGTKSIIFGYYATIMKGKFLERIPWADLVISGEPELTLKEVLAGREPGGIQGLAFRTRAGQVMENPERGFIENLDELPFGSHHLIDFSKYLYPLSGKPLTVVQVSRGCPFSCSFCLATFMNGRRFRTRSVKNVLDEIEHAIVKTGVSTFFLRADTFTTDKRWIRDFCTGLAARKLSIEWFTNSRIDTIPGELVPLMASTGCRIIGIGIESGIPLHQEKLGKHVKLEGIKEKLDLLRKHGIMTVIYFLIGTPFDTEKTINYNIDYSKKLNPTFVEFTQFVNFEGIELKNTSMQSSMPANTIKKIGRRGELLFYFRPKKIMEITKIVERNLLLNVKRILFLFRVGLGYFIRVLLR